MTDDDLSAPLADALRRLGVGPAPEPTRELAALFTSTEPGRWSRVARHGLSFGVAVKVLVGTGVLGAASVGAAHVVTHHSVPHDRPPAVVVPASEPPFHHRPARKPEPSWTAHPGRPIQPGDQDSHPPSEGTSRDPGSSDGDGAGPTASASDDGSDGGG
jgi:hypothetical protein